jgi:hypothetical protein
MAINPAVAKLVEKQMRNWELTRSQRPAEPEPPKRPEVEDFVCLSRMVGIDIGDLAAELGRRLGWPVFGKEILEAMAGDDFVRRQIYATMDERDLGWTEEVLRSLLRQELGRNDYFHRLSETLLSLARQASSIFVGRGGDLILPADRGFRVRLVASPASRVRAYRELHGVSAAEAETALERVERERSEFFRHHFHREAQDPTRHDLTINLDRFTLLQAVDLILEARRIRREE